MPRSQLPEEARHDATRLARLVMTGDSDEDRNRAMEGLLEVIRRIARQVTKNLSPAEWRQGLVDEAPSIVWEKLRSGNYDVEKGPFEAWCRTALRNWSIDQIRRRGRDNALFRAAGALGSELSVPQPDPQPTWDAALERTEPLGAADLERVERWPEIDRVLLLCLSGLWPRVPAPIWRRWLDACDLDEPFPPEGFLDLDAQSERYTVLAPALNLCRNSLAQRTRRGKHRLLELDVVTIGKEERS